MSLQITPVRSYASKGRWSNLRAVCSTVGLYCVTTTWQQIFIGSLQVTIESVLPHVTVEKHTFWQVYCSERVTVDSGKQRIIILCKTHELICSNASTSLKNFVASVRLSVINVPEWISWSKYAYAGLFSHSIKLCCYLCRLVGILSEQVQSCICCGEFSQFICSFLLSLCGVLNLVGCAIAVVNVQVYFSLFETVLRECLTFLIFQR